MSVRDQLKLTISERTAQTYYPQPEHARKIRTERPRKIKSVAHSVLGYAVAHAIAVDDDASALGSPLAEIALYALDQRRRVYVLDDSHSVGGLSLLITNGDGSRR